MSAISPIGLQHKYVNQQQPVKKSGSADDNTAPAVNVTLVRAGNGAIYSQAEAVFKRADAYSHYSSQAKRMINGCPSVVIMSHSR